MGILLLLFALPIAAIRLLATLECFNKPSADRRRGLILASERALNRCGQRFNNVRCPPLAEEPTFSATAPSGPALAHAPHLRVHETSRLNRELTILATQQPLLRARHEYGIAIDDPTALVGSTQILAWWERPMPLSCGPERPK